MFCFAESFGEKAKLVIFLEHCFGGLSQCLFTTCQFQTKLDHDNNTTRYILIVLIFLCIFVAP